MERKETSQNKENSNQSTFKSIAKCTYANEANHADYNYKFTIEIEMKCANKPHFFCMCADTVHFGTHFRIEHIP